MYGYYGYDTLFLAVIVVFILGIWAQIRVKNTYKKYSQEYASSGVTAANMAERMLSEHGSSVQVTMIPGSLTDNYNPRTGRVSLSQSTYGSTSVAALADRSSAFAFSTMASRLARALEIKRSAGRNSPVYGCLASSRPERTSRSRVFPSRRACQRSSRSSHTASGGGRQPPSRQIPAARRKAPRKA